jgi:hypothetical protein
MFDRERREARPRLLVCSLVGIRSCMLGEWTFAANKIIGMRLDFDLDQLLRVTHESCV